MIPTPRTLHLPASLSIVTSRTRGNMRSGLDLSRTLMYGAFLIVRRSWCLCSSRLVRRWRLTIQNGLSNGGRYTLCKFVAAVHGLVRVNLTDTDTRRSRPQHQRPPPTPLSDTPPRTGTGSTSEIAPSHQPSRMTPFHLPKSSSPNSHHDSASPNSSSSPHITAPATAPTSTPPSMPPVSQIPQSSN